MKARLLAEFQFAAIADLVRARTGLSFAEGRRQHAEAGIRRAMETSDAADPDRFIRLLHSDGRTFRSLVECLTVAETYFFRERGQFDALRRTVLPELRRRIVHEGTLRVWSAGCATGEEAYSLAILLEQEALAGRASIVATDISQAALALARKGAYGAWSFRDNPPDLIEQYFHRRGDKLVLIERIRRMVEFSEFNLASEFYPPRITGPAGLDLILCRNVLIYFDAGAVEQVAQQMFAALKDGGWLIAGPSDPPLWPHAPFETMLTPAGVLYRRNGAIAERRKPAAMPTSPGDGPSRAVIPVPVAKPPMPRAAVRKAPAPRPKPKPDTAEACIARLQATAKRGDPQHTADAMASALAAHPLSAEVHYFQAILHMSGDRYEEAAASLRRAIYLDQSMAVAHFALASIMQRRGAIAEARRCYRNVLAACDRRRADDVVPFSEGEQAGRLAEAARAQLASIRTGTGGRR